MKFILILFLLSIILTGCSNDSNTNNQYTASRTSILSQDNQISQNQQNSKPKEPTETDISSFSTKIYTPDDEARQQNITLACSTLNGTIVKSGETFSFCDTLGQATPQAGYKKADVFDKNGNTVKGYGGGKCQISSTLYNAVLNLPSLTVIERHEHSDEVYYVPEGKDAAVSYGSVDFKFRNDYDYDIKIYASNTKDSIDIRLTKLENI